MTVVNMTPFQKLRSLVKRKWLKNNEELAEDGAKYLLIFSQMVAGSLKIWPENFSTSTTIIFSITIALCILQEISLFLFIEKSVEDMLSLTKVLPSISIILQSMVKGGTVYYKAKEVIKLINILRHEFWPSHTMGEKLDHKIRVYSKILAIAFVLQYVFAVAFLTFLVLRPIIEGNRQLPHASWFPFDWTLSPVFEIIYGLQMYITVYFNENIICFYDSLYFSICANCVAQFWLISEAIKQIGTGKEHEIIQRLLKIPGANYQSTVKREDENERTLLVICIRHHQKLIEVSDQLNKIFEYGHFVQVLASVLGTCMPVYRIKTNNPVRDIIFVISFYMAHVMQLFEYCFFSNELSYWSTDLSRTAFQSLWYTKKYTDIRRCLSVIIMRSQNPISMNGLKLFELNNLFFISVVKFTFSLYSLVS